MQEDYESGQLDYLERKLTRLAEKRVRRGMKKLDKAFPDWPTHIQLNYLDLSSGNQCVLGQLAPSMLAYLQGGTEDEYEGNAYSAGVEALWPNGEDEDVSVRHGFCRDGIIDWRRLNNAWEIAIGARQREAAQVSV